MAYVNLLDFFDNKYSHLNNYNEIEKFFFERIKLRNNTYKSTSANRMNDVNNVLLEKMNFDSNKKINIHDVGISSGISTLEMYLSFKEVYKNIEVTGSDAFLNGTILNFSKNFNILIDNEGYLLNYNTKNALYGNYHKRNILMHSLPYYLFINLYLFLFRKLILKRNQLFPFKIIPVKFVNPIIHNYEEISLIEDDVLVENSALKNKFDLIRAANILNLSYFKEPEIKQIISVLKHRLIDGGFLVINRTDEQSKNNGTIFTLDKKNDKLNVFYRIGKGTEIEDIVITD